MSIFGNMEYVSLNNGVKMPILGFDVYQVEDPAFVMDLCSRSYDL